MFGSAKPMPWIPEKHICTGSEAKIKRSIAPIVQVAFCDYMDMIELLPNDLPDLPFGGWHATSSPELRIAACAFCAGVNPAYHEKDV
jgi:hypothetical protein